MKTLLLILSLVVATNGVGQKVFNISAVSLSYTGPDGISLPINVKCTVIITDTTYSYDVKGHVTNYTIVKKINENYFKITDGLKDYIITITPNQTIYKKYKGFIKQEKDREITLMFFK